MRRSKSSLVSAKARKLHINEIRQAYLEMKEGKLCPNRAAIGLANTLTRDIETLFKGQNKFIFELLQNADDSGEEKTPIAIEFILSGSRLIVRHNGRPFNREDVEKICDNAQQVYRDKIDDRNKTGYKGIGFKAVFSISDYVCIISGGYQFRFEKDYWEREFPDFDFDTKPVPWPLMPIWTEKSELDLSVQDMLTDACTYFIIDLKDPQKVHNELAYLLDNPELALFLRNTRSVTLEFSGKKNHIQIRENGIRREIYINRQLKKAYVQSKVFQIIIPEDIRSELDELSDFECPKKFKIADTVPMQFAASLDKHGHVLSTQENMLYCYLPTQVELSLPYIVNSDFLLNADRTVLLDNIWNHNLFNFISHCQFLWLKSLALTDIYRDQILYLIGGKTILGAGWFRRDYEQGYIYGAKHEAFLPSHRDPARLLTLEESVVDKIEFWRLFPDFKDSNYPQRKLVRYQLEGLKEKACFPNIFDAQQLMSGLNQYVQQSREVAVHIKLLKYLFNLNQSQSFPISQGFSYVPFYHSSSYSNKDQNQDKLGLKEINFLMCSDFLFRAPQEVYLRDGKAKIPVGWPKAISFYTLHPELTAALSVELRKWLIDLGAMEFSASNLLTKHLLPYLSQSQQNADDHLEAFAFIFRRLAPDAKGLDHAKKSHLFALASAIYVFNNVKPKSQLVLVSECFFSEDYKPNNAIRGNISESKQLSPVYLKIAGLDLEGLREFFKKLHVRQGAFVVRYLNYTYQQALKNKYILAQQYFNHLSSASGYRKASENASVSLFIDMPVLDRQHEGEQFISIFWDKITRDWESIKKDLPKIHYKGRSVISFLEYRLKYNGGLFHEGRYLLSTHFFTADFSEFKVLPTVPEGLPADLAEFIGVKKSLNFDNIISVLMFNNTQAEPNIKIYSKLFQALLELSPQLTPSHFQQLKNKSIRLPAENNTLQTVGNLSCFSGRSLNQRPPKSANWLKELPQFSRTETQRIAGLFGIPLVENLDIKVISSDSKENDGPMVAFRKILPVLVLIGHEKEPLPLELLKNLLQKLASLTAFSVRELKIDIAGSMQVKRCVAEADKIYFKGGWPSAHIHEIFEVIADRLNLSQRTIETAKNISHYTEEQLLEWLEEEEDLSAELYQQLNRQLREDKGSSEQKPASQLPKAPSVGVVEPELEPEELPMAGLSISDHKESLEGKAEQLNQTPPQLVDSKEQKGSQKKWSASEQSRRSDEKVQLPESQLLTFDSPRRGAVAQESAVAAVPSERITPARQPRQSVSEAAIDHPFLPVVSAEEFEIKNIGLVQEVIEGRQHSVSIRLSSPSQVTPERDLHAVDDGSSGASPRRVPRDAAAIGLWGEQVVFRHLREHYKNKYQCELKEIDHGFQLKAVRSLPDGSSEPIHLEVIWCNKYGESYGPVDFKITKNGRVRYVEVKTTRSGSSTELFISANEWTLMMQENERYRIFRVYNAGHPSARIGKIKNPAESVRKGNLTPNKSSFVL